MLDPTSNLYLETNGVPLNAWEIRQEWFYRRGTNLTFVVGRDRKRYRKNDLPIVLGRFADFGELAVHPDELDKYGFIGYIPNTDLMNNGYDYGKMFITKDRLCDGTPWHVRTLPANPAEDPYFPVNQAALRLQVSGETLEVQLQTLTPNFSRFEVRINGGNWTPSRPSFTWPLQTGANRLEARTMNRFEITGPISSAMVEVKQKE